MAVILMPATHFNTISKFNIDYHTEFYHSMDGDYYLYIKITNEEQQDKNLNAITQYWLYD